METSGQDKDINNLLIFLQQGGNEKKSILAEKLTADEWSSLVELARRQRVTPYLFSQLSKTNIPIPEKTLELLRKQYLRNAARNIRLYKNLDRVLGKLVEENIPVILLKGVFLAEAVYDNIGIRPMTDLDLLLPARDVEKAIRGMEDIGFLPERPFWSEVDGELHFHAPTMTKDGIFLELHWNLTRETNISTINQDELWTRAQPYTLGKIRVMSLDLNDQLLHLAIHASYGHTLHEQLLSLIDIKELLVKFGKDLDWKVLVQRCKEWRVERGTFLVLRLISEFFNVRSSTDIIEQLMPNDWNENILDWAKYRVFQTEPVLSENFIQLMEGKSVGNKIRGLVTGFFPTRKVMAMVYGIPNNSWRILAKYPSHIFTRIQRYWKPFIHRIRGDKQQETSSTNDQALREWLGVR